MHRLIPHADAVELAFVFIYIYKQQMLWYVHFRLQGCLLLFFILIQILIDHPVSKHQRTWSDIAVCGVWSWPVLVVYVPQKER